MKSFLLFCLFLFALEAGAQTNLYVDGSVATSGAGTSWTAPYKTLNEALNVVNAASPSVKYVVHIAQGTYYPTGVQSGTKRDSTFLLARGGVRLLGGYASGGSGRNPTSLATILSGNIGSGTTNTDNSYHVMVIAANTTVTDSIVLDGVRLMFGNANGSGNIVLNGLAVNRNMGGGLFAAYPLPGRITMNACWIRNDTASGDGGGAFLYGTALHLNGCSVRFNTSLAGSGGGVCGISNLTAGTNTAISGYNTHFISCRAINGGGISNIRSAATSIVPDELLDNCPFISNFALQSGGGIRDSSLATIAKGRRTLKNCLNSSDSAQNGGIIFSSNYTLQVISSYLNSSIAVQNGGAIYTRNGSLLIDSCLSNTNFAGGGGGGFYNLSPTTISNTSIWSDTAVLGGAIYQGAYPLSLDHVNLFLNRAMQSGGAIFNAGTLTISKTSISGNHALIQGGAIYNQGGTGMQSFTNVHFTGNKANISGGALYDTLGAQPAITFCTFAGDTAVSGSGIYNAGGSSPTIINSIVWEGVNNSIVDAGSSSSNVTYSMVEGGHAGSGNSSSNPRFVGPIARSLAPTNAGTYSLLPCSPAIDSGSFMTAYVGTKDIRDSTRFFGNGMDMGAYEAEVIFPLPITGGSSVCVNSTLQLANGISGGYWISSNTSIATINSSGVVTGVSAGTDTISYNSTLGVCSGPVSRVITVLPLPVVPSIGGGRAICIGDTTRLSNATAGGTWSSLNPGIATVNAVTGVVTGVSTGTASISYFITGTNGCTNLTSKSISVSAFPVVGTITGIGTICTNSTAQLSILTTGGTWTSSDTTVAGIDQSGILSPKTAGMTTIKYTVSNGVCSTSASHPVSVNSVDATTTQNGAALSANQAGASYRWLRCGAGYTYILGATGKNYTATANGQYAVAVTINGCSDTSDCITVAGLGIGTSIGNAALIDIYPNPTTGKVTIAAPGITIKEIITRDVTGKKLDQLVPGKGKIELDMTGYSEGVYLIEVSDGRERYTRRVSIIR